MKITFPFAAQSVFPAVVNTGKEDALYLAVNGKTVEATETLELKAGDSVSSDSGNWSYSGKITRVFDTSDEGDISVYIEGHIHMREEVMLKQDELAECVILEGHHGSAFFNKDKVVVTSHLWGGKEFSWDGAVRFLKERSRRIQKMVKADSTMKHDEKYYVQEDVFFRNQVSLMGSDNIVVVPRGFVPLYYIDKNVILFSVYEEVDVMKKTGQPMYAVVSFDNNKFGFVNQREVTTTHLPGISESHLFIRKDAADKIKKGLRDGIGRKAFTDLLGGCLG